MQRLLIYCFITSFYVISISANCINFQLSISQKVEHEGFHREINWLIESLDLNNESWNESKCRASLKLDVPPGMFANPDQISDLNRAGKISAIIGGNVNVELPAHEAEGHTVYVFLPQSNLQKVSVKLPVHLRYQRAAIAGGFGKVSLKRPSLLVYCPTERELNVCGQYPKIRGPCDVLNSSTCAWQNVTYQELFDEVQLFVPIGDLDDYPLVSVVTLLLGCAGSIYVLSILSTAPL